MFFSRFVVVLIFPSIVECKDQQLPSSSFVMPTFFWDPRNPLFNCPYKGVNTINIRMNDYFRLACPKPGRFIDWHESPNVVHDDMYGNAFLTDNKAAADNCTAGSLTSILDCNDPLNSNKYRTIRIAQHSGIDTDPLFKYNTAYYIFSTATGSSSGINNLAGGRCNTSKPNEYKMILKMNVCAYGEAGTDKCPICLTAACYNKRCGQYGEWNDTIPRAYYRDITNLQNDSVVSARKSIDVVNNENSCFVYKKRKCDDSVMGCEGADTKKSDVSCPSVEVEPMYKNCTPLVSKLYRDFNGSCLNISHQNCFIGSLEKFQVTRWYKNITSCPPTTIPPTTTTAPPCPGWRNLTGIFKNGTASCYRVQSRRCNYCHKNITEVKFVNSTCPVQPSPSAVPRSTSIFTSVQTSSPCPAPTTVQITERVTLTSTYTATVLLPSLTHTTICSSSIEVKGVSSLSLSQTITRSSDVATSTAAMQSRNGEGTVLGTATTIPVSSIASTSASPSPSPTPKSPGSLGRSGLGEDGTDYKNYLIPIISAIVGCFLGAFSVWYYKRHDEKKRTCIKKPPHDIEETNLQGIYNEGYVNSLGRDNTISMKTK